MNELGSLLQKTRLDKKQTVTEVSNNTRIIEAFIKLMEEGQFKQLPSYIHAYGFVKKYSEYLELDYKKDIEPLFAVEYPKPSITDTLHQSDKKQNNESDEDIVFTIDNDNLDDNQDVKSKSKTAKIGLILLILVVGIYGGYLLFKNNGSNESANNQTNTIVIDESSIEETEPVEEILEESNLVEETTEAIEENAVQNATTSVDPLLGVDKSIPAEDSRAELQVATVTFSDDCWFKYGSDLFEEREVTAKKGDRINIEFTRGFSITMGNAIAVSLQYKDQYLGKYGKKDEAKFNIKYVLKDGRLEYSRNNY